MKYHDLKTHLDHQRHERQPQPRLIHHREIMQRIIRDRIHGLEQEIALLARLIGEIKHDRLHEDTVKPTKPLTPDQSMKRAERDRKRQQRIKDVQVSATTRIADIRSQIGQ